jgi:bifunctional non-homologous end joining protein LigD
MLPHLIDRPLTIVRCPEGSAKQCFYQKHAGPSTPDILRRVAIQEKEALEDYLVIDDLAGLLSLVQMGVLEVHIWGSRSDDVERPDRLVFDLDPDPSVGWKQVVECATAVRGQLDELGLTSFVKTTGGKGLHVVVPIKRTLYWDEAKSFTKALTERVVDEAPQLYTSTMAKAARRGKIFIDYFRNDRGATSVAAYSTRARAGAPVSVPVEWKDLDAISASEYTVENLPSRLASRRRDPWKDLAKTRQAITAAMKKKLGV